MNEPGSTLDRLVAKAGQLYSLPTVAMQVLELTKNPTVDAHLLKACIENDPALTTKLLRVVNSSLFGLSRKVVDLGQALALLGTKPLKLLVLGFSLPNGLFAGVAGAVLARYWRRTLTKAVTARELAETFWKHPADEVFIAALLQDLGMLLLIQELGEPYIRLIEKAAARGENLLPLERASMGFDHTQLSARLLAHWGLPPSVVDAVAWRTGRAAETAEQAPPAVVEILHVAELFARLLVDGSSEVLTELLDAAQRSRKLTKEQLEGLVDVLDEKVRQLADVLSLQLPDNLGYRDLLARAHAQLAEVACDAAEAMLRQQFQSAADDEGLMLASEVQSLSEAVARMASRPEVAQRQPGAAPRAAPAAATAALDEVDPGLLGPLSAAVTACRQSRSSLSLLLVELDAADDLVLRYGVERLGSLRRFLEVLCRRVDHRCAICLPHGEVGFAVILPRCDRQTAIQVGNQMIDRIRQLGLGRTRTGRPAVSISVGVATVALPPRNFPAYDLFVAANRCLYGAHASGGGVLKSIEIY